MKKEYELMGKQNNKYYPITIDTEWCSDGSYISLQCFVKQSNKLYFYYNVLYNDKELIMNQSFSNRFFLLL